MTIIGYPQDSLKQNLKYKSAILSIVNCLIGSMFLALMSRVTLYLPYTPIPLTMQTFALFMMILVQGKKHASASVALYLVQATLGLPVLAVGVNPLWMVGPTAGYLIGFLGCTYVGGYIVEKQKHPNFLTTMGALVAGLVVVYASGSLFLASFYSLSQAFAVGTLPFLGMDLLKAAAATCLFLSVRKIVATPHKNKI